MKTQRNKNAFREFCMMSPLDEVDHWYDGDDICDVIVVLKNGRVCRYDSFEHSMRYADSIEKLFKSPENEDEWQRIFSYNLYRVMRRRGYNRVGLAESSGVSQAMITNYINGKSIPTAYKLMRIADALGCTVNDLIYF